VEGTTVTGVGSGAGDPALATDLERLHGWSGAHPAARAEISVDRSAALAGQGEPLIVVCLDDPAAHRAELVDLLDRPDRLRVRPRRPDPADLARLLRWVVDTQMRPAGSGRATVSSAGIDEAAGVVVVTLDRPDPRYAAELAAAGGGLLRVAPRPVVVEAIPPATQTREPPPDTGP
jgi:hypothetical protein